MVHSMPLKNVSVQGYKATIRTFRSSLVLLLGILQELKNLISKVPDFTHESLCVLEIL